MFQKCPIYGNNLFTWSGTMPAFQETWVWRGKQKGWRWEKTKICAWLDNSKLGSTQQQKICWHWNVARIISSQKIYGLYARKHHIVEMRGDVTDARRQTNEQLKGGWVSQYILFSQLIYKDDLVCGRGLLALSINTWLLIFVTAANIVFCISVSVLHLYWQYLISWCGLNVRWKMLWV